MTDRLPRDPMFDGAPAFLAQGYNYISNRCRRLGTDVFETRLAGVPFVCARGADAARTFYGLDPTRAGALPPTMFTLLQDKGSVASLDGEAHGRRKELFLATVGRDALDRLLTETDAEWHAAIERWRRADHVVLLDEAEALLCRAACRWAGVPVGEPEAQARTAEFSAMIDGAGSVGLRNLKGQLLRRRTERWLADQVEAVRAGHLEAPPGTALERFSHWTGADGSPLPSRVAAVELCNVIRPTVAVARYVAFEAMALHRYPDTPTDDPRPFVQEVRRFAPFFPAVAGRVGEGAEWDGVPLPAGRRVLLDLYGTNRDPATWEDPDEFRPERFSNWEGDPFTLIPQGGGDHATGHRCPGEWATIALMEQAVGKLAGELRYDVPPQDLTVSRSRVPTQPESRFVIRNVRPRAA